MISSFSCTFCTAQSHSINLIPNNLGCFFFQRNISTYVCKWWMQTWNLVELQLNMRNYWQHSSFHTIVTNRLVTIEMLYSKHTSFTWSCSISCGVLQWSFDIRLCSSTPMGHKLCRISLSRNEISVETDKMLIRLFWWKRVFTIGSFLCSISIIEWMFLQISVKYSDVTTTIRSSVSGRYHTWIAWWQYEFMKVVSQNTGVEYWKKSASITSFFDNYVSWR